MISKKSVKRSVSIAIMVFLTTGCIPEIDNEQDLFEKTPPIIGVGELTNPQVNYLNKLEETHEFLTFESNYAVTSKFGDFGEEVTFLPDKVRGDLIVAKGSYSSGVLFYRIYNMAYDKKQIIFEVTNENKEAYEQFEKSEDVFSYKNRKPTTLVKSLKLCKLL